jgi:hypothetical protein
MVQRCCVPLCDTKVGDVDIKGTKVRLGGNSVIVENFNLIGGLLWNSQVTVIILTPQVRFHRIPLTPEKFRKWRDKITNCAQYSPEPELTVNSRVCSKHFLREDYISEENEKDNKPGTPGNHILGKDAIPTVFKWNDCSGQACQVSRAIPYVKKPNPVILLTSQEHKLANGRRSQEVQCSLLEEKLQREIYRKNLVIRQLLQRLAEVDSSSSSSPSVVNIQETAEEVDKDGLVVVADLIPSSSQASSSPSPPILPEEVINAVIEPVVAKVSKATWTEDDSYFRDGEGRRWNNNIPQRDNSHDDDEDRPKTTPTCIKVHVIKRAPRQSDMKMPPKKRRIYDF